MFEFEPGLILWTSVSFGLLVLLLYRLGVPALIAFLAEREKYIAETLSDAADTAKRAEATLAENRKQLEQAQAQADRILAQAKLEGEKLKSETVAKAEKKAQLIVEQAQQELSQQKDKLTGEVKRAMAELLASAAGKLLHRVVSVDEHHKLIEQSLAEVEPNNERNRRKKTV
jgi:F-type H+-transporting ATPase subunit b